MSSFTVSFHLIISLSFYPSQGLHNFNKYFGLTTQRSYLIIFNKGICLQEQSRPQQATELSTLVAQTLVLRAGFQAVRPATLRIFILQTTIFIFIYKSLFCVEHLVPFSVSNSHLLLLLYSIMADPEERVVAVNLADQRMFRAREQVCVERLLEDVINLKDHRTSSSLSYPFLKEKQTKLCHIMMRGNKVMDLLLHAEDDVEEQGKDKVARAKFLQVMERIVTICQDMITSKTVDRLSISIQESMDDLKGIIDADPSKDYAACFPDLTKELEEMNTVLLQSNFPTDHDSWKLARKLKRDLRLLKAMIKDGSKPMILPVADFHKAFNMPKLNIPKFKGGLAEWHSFWNRFRTAVHDNERMNEQVKMAHLIDMITDPALSDYMVAANDGEEGRYQQAIKYLQERFNRPRELHSIYCRRLSEMQPIKGTPAELSAAADAVFAAVSGLRRSGQSGVDYIATYWWSRSSPITSGNNGRARRKQIHWCQTLISGLPL